ncbi:hypothetical protein GJAV_G00155940 [Gymnothorax javanicus]|nr:hypothetical protein GJAV_G00155940 [Gymnothorax javanicus]
MASGSSPLCEQQFLCPLCRDVFSGPVSTPCGHSFCRACISSYWAAGAACRCPRCGSCFAGRPELCENTFARDMADRLRRGRPQPSMPRPPDAEEPHLDHLGEEFQQSHRLPQPIRSLEERMCQKHSRALELFCRRDQMCMCILCAEFDHRSHDFVPVVSEWSEKQVQLKQRRAEVQQMMQDRWKKVEEIRQCVELSRSSTEKEMEHSVQVFDALMRSVKAGQAQLSEVMQEQQRAMEKRAEVLIKEVEQELTLLQNRRSQLEKLSQTEDHLYFLQVPHSY